MTDNTPLSQTSQQDYGSQQNVQTQANTNIGMLLQNDSSSIWLKISCSRSTESNTIEKNNEIFETIDILADETIYICESFLPSVKKSLLFVFAGLKSVVRQREGHRRVIVLLGVFNFMCYIFTYNGTEGTHRYYYAQADTWSTWGDLKLARQIEKASE